MSFAAGACCTYRCGGRWFEYTRLRAASQPSRAGLVLEEVGVRHVERHSRLRSSDELSALHAPLDDGPGGRAASRPCEGSQPSVRGAGLLAGRAVKGVS